MTNYEIYIVDAFTSNRFSGNPAAVCYLGDRSISSVSEKQMRDVAKEMNLSETAFLAKIDEGSGIYALKWFTPTTEVKLCGHATLASAHVLFTHLKVSQKGVTRLTFKTLSGDLFVVQNENGLIEMDFPQGFCHTIDLGPEVILNLTKNCAISQRDILGTFFDEKSGKLIVEMTNLESIISAKVSSDGLLQMSFPVNVRGISLTTSNLSDQTHCKNCDFASRYFSPWNGIPEDPVNGSSHAILGPFYKKKLNKNSFTAYMASERTGHLYISLEDVGRVRISGYAVTTLSGLIRVS